MKSNIVSCDNLLCSLTDVVYGPMLSMNASSGLITADNGIYTVDQTTVYIFSTLFYETNFIRSILTNKPSSIDNITLSQTAGIKFPIILSNNGSVDLTYGKDLIKSSIIIILSWPIRTRYFNSLFGSRVHEVLEDPNDDVLSMLVRKFVIDPITDWEPRVELKSVNIFRQDPDKLTVNVIYNIRELNVEDSIFYIYYIN